MPKLSIYVPQALYRLLAETDGMNVSAVCQRALAEALNASEHEHDLDLMLARVQTDIAMARSRLNGGTKSG